MLNFVNILLA